MNGQFASFAQFVAMGGYGLYVWASYGLALAILLGNVLVPLWQWRRFMIAAQRRLRRNNADR